MAQHLNPRLRQQISQRLRELRLKAGISYQESLAHKAKVHRTYVGRLERGESGVTVEALAAILAALSVSLDQFLQAIQRGGETEDAEAADLGTGPTPPTTG